MEAIWKLIIEYHLQNRVLAFCFDTTSVNSGNDGGICVLLDQKFWPRKILFLACRRHIYEIFLSAAFTEMFGKSGKLK